MQSEKNMCATDKNDIFLCLKNEWKKNPQTKKNWANKLNLI